MKHSTPKAGWKRWSLPVRIGIAGLACLLIAKQLSWTELKTAVADLKLWTVIVGIIVYTLSQFLVGLRWWWFLRAQRIAVPLATAVKLNYLGLFYSNFLPSSVGGDLVRAWYVSHYSRRKLQAALGVLLDRIMGLIATLILAVAALFAAQNLQVLQIQPMGGTTFRLGTPFWPYGIAFGLVVVGAILVLYKPFLHIMYRLYRHIIHLIRQLRKVLTVYYHHPFVLIGAIGITIFLQSLVIMAYWLIGRDLNIDAPLIHYFVFFPLVWVVGSIPISISGIGILEGGLVFLFVRYSGTSTEAAAALALCQRLTWLGASLPGLLIHLTGSYRPPSRSAVSAS
ncbi:MAG: flippase-like domain-containing protein [Planctomycetes bacterium]|nr:flippase-like domain-containing protein [Planctomycetota bacterium]